VGALVGMTRDGYTIIGDIVRFRGTPGAVERAIQNTASQDGFTTQIGLEQEPGASGKSEGQYLVRQLGGYAVTLYPAQNNKETNWKPLSSQAEAGNVMVVKGPWNEALFSELEAVPEGHDDQADAVSGGYHMLYDLIIRQGLPAASWL